MESHGIPPSISCCGIAIQLVHRRYNTAEKSLVIQYKTEKGPSKNSYSSDSDEEDYGNNMQQFGRSMPSIGSVPIEPNHPIERKRSVSSSYENNSYLSSSMNRSHRGSFMNPGFMLSSSPTSGIRASFGSRSKSASFHTGTLSASRSFSNLDSSAKSQHKSNPDYCPEKSIQLNVLSEKWTESRAIDIEASSQHDDMFGREETIRSNNIAAKCYRMLRPKVYMLEIGQSQLSVFDSDSMSDQFVSPLDGVTATSTRQADGRQGDGPEVMTISITLRPKSSADETEAQQPVFLNGKEVVVLDYIGQNRRWSKSESGAFKSACYFDIDGDIFGDIMDIHDEQSSPSDGYTVNTAIARKEDSPTNMQVQKNLFGSQAFDEPTVPLTVQEPKPLVNAHDTLFKALEVENSNNLDTKASATVNGISTYERELADGSKIGVTECIWENCSIWDVKAIVDCPGISAQWDPAYDSGQVIGNLSPRCTVHSSYYKSSWRASLKEYLSVSATYASLSRLRYVSLSFDGVSDGQSIAKQTTGDGSSYLLNGWQMDSLDDGSCSVKYLAQKEAKRDFVSGDTPPTLAYIVNGSLNSVQYDSRNSSWRCQYEQNRAQKSPSASNHSSIVYLRLPVQKEVMKQKGFSVSIDPPCDHLLTVINLPGDKAGIWLRIEHSQNAMTHDNGSTLLLVKRSENVAQLQVNGSTPRLTDFNNYAEVVHFVSQEDLPLQLLEKLQSNMKNISATDTLPSRLSNASRLNMPMSDSSSHISVKGGSVVSDQQTVEDGTEDVAPSIFDELPVSTQDQAAAACLYLHRMSDQHFGWVHVSDRNGMRIQKRSGGEAAPVETVALDTSAPIVSDTLEQQFPTIPAHLMLMKGTKVIENFSVEEVASVVAESGYIRDVFQDTVLNVDILKPFVNGHACVKAQLKAWFPFKVRDVYIASTTATDTSSSGQTTRIIHAATSISNLKVDTETSNPLAHLYLSGWILEAVDPYTTTTNHPIPSTRVTYMGCIDLGQSIPAYISNMATSNLIKSIGRVESLLKTSGPPPRLLSPIPFADLQGGELRWSGKGIAFAGDQLVEVQYVPPQKHWMVSSSFDRAKLTLPQSASETSIKEDSPQTLKQSPMASISSTMMKSPLLAERRGSAPGRIPLGVLPNKPKVAAHSKYPSFSNLKSKVTLMDVVVDLKSFDKGYNCEVRFSVEPGHSIDLSDKLTARIEQLHPEPSYLVGSAGSLPPIKHHIEVKLDLESVTKEMKQQLYSELHNYKLTFILNPVTDTHLLAKTNKLTISGVLGEDEDKWKGITLINGQEITLNQDTKLTSLSDRHVTDARPSKQEVETGESETTIAAVFSNVVSHPALSWITHLSGSAGNATMEREEHASPVLPSTTSIQDSIDTEPMSKSVSSHIQDISNMVLSPFIPGPPSPPQLSPASAEIMHELFTDDNDIVGLDDRKSIRSSTAETQTVVVTPSHSRSHALLRQFAVIFLLSILIGVLIRSFAILAIDSDNEAATIRLLETDPSNIKQIWRMRWFGGWDVEFIAVKRR
ncbi:hypothetical protein BC943DRAFT_194172 [Umbelopsis sp. AD052]|nr:hypothetical protein BC943DRAFT_194172 [Umbelopsis sp. AD052]